MDTMRTTRWLSPRLAAIAAAAGWLAFAAAVGAEEAAAPVADTGDTAWLLTSSALVLFMTPGLALFYGGMVRTQERPRQRSCRASSSWVW